MEISNPTDYLSPDNDFTGINCFADDKLQIWNPAQTNKYIFSTSAITGSAEVILPVVTDTDTFGMLGIGQTWTGFNIFNADPATDNRIMRWVNTGGRYVDWEISNLSSAHILSLPRMDTTATIAIISGISSAPQRFTDSQQFSANVQFDVTTSFGGNADVNSTMTFQDNSIRIENPAATFDYIIQAAAIIDADRTLNLPLITGTDTLATLGLAQTFSAANTFGAVVTIDFNIGGDEDALVLKDNGVEYMTFGTAIAGFPGITAVGSLFFGLDINNFVFFNAGACVYTTPGGHVFQGSSIQALAGSAANPGYSFGGDTNTGMYAAGADTIGMSAGGTLTMAFNALVMQNFQGRFHHNTRYDSTQTITYTDEQVYGDTDSAGFTITLPSGLDGCYFRIVNVGTSGNDLTITPNGSQLLLGVNSSFVLKDGESLIICYVAIPAGVTEGWY